MERVAELVEERARVVPADEDRLSVLALHEVRVVADDRGDRALEPLLGAIGVHPRAGALAGTRVGIEVPEADVLAARLVLHLPDADVGVVDLDAGDGREGEAEELTGDPEHPLAELLELEVLLHLALVEVVLRLADLLRVEAVVPRRDLALRAALVRERLHVGDLLAHARDRWRPDLLHQRHRALGRLRHRVLEAPVGVRRVAEELRALGAELEDLGDDLLVVAGVVVVAAVDVALPHLLAEIVARRVGEERLHRRARVRDRPLALLSARLRGGGGARLHRVRKAGEVGLLVEDERVALLVGEDVLAERRVERGEALVDLGEALLRRSIELRSGAHERVPVAPHEPLLLGGELRLLGRLVDRLDALVEVHVLDDLVLERRELRRHLLLDRLERVVVHRRRPDSVDRLDAIHGAAGVLERGDRVLEGGGIGVVRDPGDLVAMLMHRVLEGGLEVLHLHLGERGHAAVRAGPRREQRVGSLRCVGRAHGCTWRRSCS